MSFSAFPLLSSTTPTNSYVLFHSKDISVPLYLSLSSSPDSPPDLASDLASASASASASVSVSVSVSVSASDCSGSCFGICSGLMSLSIVLLFSIGLSEGLAYFKPASKCLIGFKWSGSSPVSGTGTGTASGPVSGPESLVDSSSLISKEIFSCCLRNIISSL